MIPQKRPPIWKLLGIYLSITIPRIVWIITFPFSIAWIGPPLPPKWMARANELNPKLTKTIYAFARIKCFVENLLNSRIKIGR